jgi:DNA-binding CsgD family transcriptional regulator
MRALLLAVEANATAGSVVTALLGDPGVAGVTRRIVLLASAVLAGRQGDRDTAVEVSAAAFEELATTPWFCAMTQRLVGEAALLGGWGSPQQWLRAAEAFFEGAAIDAPARACRTLLEQTEPPAGEVHTSASGRGVNGVSPREADVLALVAEGMSNREIAQRLFLSVRTVEKHVEHLLAKTGTANRAQLVALAIRADGTTATR